MLLGGTTCFNDMYFFPKDAGSAALRWEFRAVLGMIVLDFPTAFAQDSADYIARGIAVHDETRSQELLTTAWAPHAPYTVSNEPLERIRTLSEEMDVPIHIHVHETSDEVEQALQATGERPVARLANLDLLSPRLLAVHMTQLTDAEIELAGHMGINVVHCPESNLKLASLLPCAGTGRRGRQCCSRDGWRSEQQRPRYVWRNAHRGHFGQSGGQHCQRPARGESTSKWRRSTARMR